MSADTKQDARARTQMFVELRKRHGASAARAQELLKKQQAARRLLHAALQQGPRSVPQLASQCGIPAHEVLWHIASMKKYGLVEEMGLEETGAYFLYGLPQETRT